MSAGFSLERAGHWFLESGIQNSQGGVARFYRADIGKNKPVSTEITGYAASAFAYLFRATGDERYLDRARLAAAFLRDYAWDSRLGIFPFEHPSPTADSAHRAYFFDTGIIIRGLISVWHQTKDDSLIDLASTAAHGMLTDFGTGEGGEYHPILTLPDKGELDRAQYWSNSAACYQAKSALGWWELADVTGDAVLRQAFTHAIDAALRSHRDFLPGTDSRPAIMDRLHAYNYFLEALYPLLPDREDCRDAYRYGIAAVEKFLRDIAGEFARSDVYAQLLRARLFGCDVLPLDEKAASEEACALAKFQFISDDPRLDGGFAFGRRGANMVPHANPVSTAFAIQTLHLWQARQAGENNPCRMPPI